MSTPPDREMDEPNRPVENPDLELILNLVREDGDSQFTEDEIDWNADPLLSIAAEDEPLFHC